MPRDSLFKRKVFCILNTVFLYLPVTDRNRFCGIEHFNDNPAFSAIFIQLNLRGKEMGVSISIDRI